MKIVEDKKVYIANVGQIVLINGRAYIVESHQLRQIAIKKIA